MFIARCSSNYVERAQKRFTAAAYTFGVGGRQTPIRLPFCSQSENFADSPECK